MYKDVMERVAVVGCVLGVGVASHAWAVNERDGSPYELADGRRGGPVTPWWAPTDDGARDAVQPEAQRCQPSGYGYESCLWQGMDTWLGFEWESGAGSIDLDDVYETGGVVPAS